MNVATHWDAFAPEGKAVNILKYKAAFKTLNHTCAMHFALDFIVLSDDLDKPG